MTLEAGTRLGAFEILRPLGVGGMGEVYRARDVKLEREVAVKILPRKLAERPERMARFEREAKLLAALDHPHIGAIHGLHEDEGLHFLVMELVEGTTLAERLRRGALPVRDALELGRQLAEALEAAHTKGIVHRDLKPGNVMLTSEGRAKLLDFGLGKALADDTLASSLGTETTPDATTEGVVIGTAPYMSPEQARGEEVDPRTDIWSFGCVLYESLTGRRAFPGKTRSDAIAAVLEREPDWEALPDATPLAVRWLLRRCLRKNRASRLAHAGDARIEIEEVLSGPTDETEVGGLRPAVAPRSRWRHAHAAATALLLAASLVFGYLLMSAASPEGRVIRFEVPPPKGTTFNLDPMIPGPGVVSPNGRLLTFSARDEEGKVRLYVRPIDATEARVLAGSDDAFYPFWSPDSQLIGFFTRGRLKKVAAAGGSPLTLCEAPSGRGGSWSPDGVIVFAPGSNTPLHRVSDAGGESTPVTRLDSNRGDTTHRFPHFLPDGRRFVFLARGDAATGGQAVLVESLDGGDERLLLRSTAQAAYASDHLLFLRGRTLMAQPFDAKRVELSGVAIQLADGLTIDEDAHHAVFSASQNGVLAYHAGGSRDRSRLEWFDREGASLGQLGDAAAYAEVHLSPDDTHASVSLSAEGTRDVWVYEIAAGKRTRFTFGPINWLPGAWSPDGSELVYTSIRNGLWGLYRKSLIGPGEETLLIESDTTKFPESWSPDGQLLVFDHELPATGFDTWVLPLEGGEAYPFLETPFTDSGGTFSPDGRWLSYHSDKPGRWEVYVTPFPGPGRKWQVSSDGGAWSRWRGDGKEIYYHGLNGRLMAVPVDVRNGSFVGGEAEPLFDVGKLGHFYIFDATQDGQRFLVVRPEQAVESLPLTVVVNWPRAVAQ